jgi:hypothetical protein
MINAIERSRYFWLIVTAGSVAAIAFGWLIEFTIISGG